jgi:hypothetical protein
MKRLAIFFFLAFLLVSCSDEDPATPLVPSDPVEPPNGFELHILDIQANLAALKHLKFEELTEEFQHYPGLPKNVLIGLTYLEVNPSRTETLVELAVGTEVGFLVDDCSVEVFMRHHVLNPRALTDTISIEPQIAYIKDRHIVSFRRFGQIDEVMSEITWRVVLLCPRESTGVKPF